MNQAQAQIVIPDAWLEHFEFFEGRVPHFYVDTRNNVTCGIGCRVFEPDTIPMVRKKDNVVAVITEKWDEYRAIKALPAGKLPPFYGKVAKLYLTDSAIEDLLRDRLRQIVVELEAEAGLTLASYPPLAQIGIVDMAANLGAHRLVEKFPHFLNAFRARDYGVCARECKRLDVPPARNQWARRVFEGLDQYGIDGAAGCR